MMERDDTVSAILDSKAFQTYFGAGNGLPTAVSWKYYFPAVLTTPGAGKSRLLHELCAHRLMREAARKRGVDIVPLHITFNCQSPLFTPPTGKLVMEAEIAARILLDASDTMKLDARFYRSGMSCVQALQCWVRQRVRCPSRDVVIILAVDEITLIKASIAKIVFSIG